MLVVGRKGRLGRRPPPKNVSYFIGLGAFSIPSLIAALRQASVAESPECFRLCHAPSGVKLMHRYRIYTFREDGHFSGFQRIECAEERQAVQKARQLVGGQDGELWDNDHLIARFPDAEKPEG